ncbi:MAG TPA: shikimate kinase [Candidatus Acidoferrum sp.]|jgi:shikimate kinase|nr:shikimate kinase [Candidatus Acidoferrum sp.]
MARPVTATVVALAGFMGSGKTTVGSQLARQLAWRFVDLDDLIEAASGTRIAEFFERHGEPSFRLLEAAQLRSALGRALELRESAVIALGGGTYAQHGAPEFLKTQSVPVIWLDSPIETLLARCMTMTGRPLFRDESSFRALHAQRIPSYQLADFRVDSSRDPSVVVAEILRLGIFPKPDPSSHLLVEEPRS